MSTDQGLPTPPQPAPVAAALAPEQERTVAMLSHLVTLLTLLVTSFVPVAPVISALVFYLAYKDRGPFVRAHTATELNLQITIVIGVVVGFVLSFVLIGFALLLAILVLWIVFGIIATIRANRGAWYVYPVAIRFVR